MSDDADDLLAELDVEPFVDPAVYGDPDYDRPTWRHTARGEGDAPASGIVPADSTRIAVSSCVAL